MAMVGFNIGSTISLGDTELALEYLLDKDMESLKEEDENVREDTGIVEAIDEEDSMFDIDEDSLFSEEDEEDTEEDTEEEEEDSETEEDEEDSMFDIDEDSLFSDEDEEENDAEDLDIDIDREDDDTDTDKEDDMFDIDEDSLFSDEDEDTEEENGEDLDTDIDEDDEDSMFDIDEDSLFSEDELDEPVEQVKKPVEQVKKPVEEVEQVKKQVEQVKKPVEEVKKPVEEVKKPVEETSISIKEKELKSRLEYLNRLKEETRKKELSILEQQVLEAEREMGLQETKVAKVVKKEVQKEVPRNDSAKQLDMYAKMDIESLYVEVKKFMIAKGVAKSVIDKKVLEDKFGGQSIKRLILKSYLITIGKGVTIGR